MTVVRVHQQHTDDWLARAVQDANQIVGERVLAVEMWNTQNAPDWLSRCKYCYNDAYMQSDTTNGWCPYCFGTTYKHGIRLAVFTSAIMSRPVAASSYDQAQGEFDSESMTANFACDVQLHMKDFVLRIDGWKVSDTGLKPKVSELYQVSENFNDAYLKDGYRFLGANHRVGAQVPLSLTDQSNPIVDTIYDGLHKPAESDMQPFVIYDRQVPIKDWEHRAGVKLQKVRDVALVTSERFSDYRVGYFQ